MKAVILAAGEGTRMRPLTKDTPKPLIPVAGKPMIQHNIDKIEDKVEEIIIVAGYKIEQFEDKYCDNENIKIVEQSEALGTADAALQARDLIDEKALVLNGDDIYGNLEKLVEKDSAVLASKAEKPENYGVFKVEDGNVEGIVEKPDNPPSSLVNTGAYVVKEDFFDLLEKVEKSARGEYEITDALEDYLDSEEVELVKTDMWLPCSYPWQLIDANEELIEEEVGTGRINGKVSENAVIEKNVVVEKGAEIKQFTTVEGPAIIKSGAEVGSNGYIRPGTVLEENVKIGDSEIKNSVVRESSSIPHKSYIGDSYIGKKVNIGAGSQTANLRNDNSTVKMKVKGRLMDTGREKFGTVIGSEAKIGVNNSVKPGRKIGFGAVTDAGEKIAENLSNKAVMKDGEIIEDRN